MKLERAQQDIEKVREKMAALGAQLKELEERKEEAENLQVKLVDDLMGSPEGKVEPEKPEAEKVEPVKAEPVNAKVKADKEVADTHPFSRSDPKILPPSEPTSESKNKSAREGISVCEGGIAGDFGGA